MSRKTKSNTLEEPKAYLKPLDNKVYVYKRDWRLLCPVPYVFKIDWGMIKKIKLCKQ